MVNNLSDSIALCVQEAPRLCADKDTEQTTTATFIFPDTFVGFNGHFPNNPIVPGIALIMSAIYTATLAGDYALKEIKRCKFLRPIKPNEKITITASATKTDEIRQCTATIEVNQEPCAQLSFTVQPQQ